jgi:hypothetical protein
MSSTPSMVKRVEVHSSVVLLALVPMCRKETLVLPQLQYAIQSHRTDVSGCQHSWDGVESEACDQASALLEPSSEPSICYSSLRYGTSFSTRNRSAHLSSPLT